MDAQFEKKKDSTPKLRQLLRHPKIRKLIFSYLTPQELASLRQVSRKLQKFFNHSLFQSLTVKFHATTFSQDRLDSLERIGGYVQELTFVFPHSERTYMHPILDPVIQRQVSLVFEPDSHQEHSKVTIFGDLETDELALQNHGIILFAASNIAAFTRAMRALKGLVKLTVSCPGEPLGVPGQRSVVDYALWSLRAGIERADLKGLQELNLAPVHLSGLQYLLPSPFAVGGTIRSKKVWSNIFRLAMHISDWKRFTEGEASIYITNLKFLHQYLSFFTNIEELDFGWVRPGSSLCPLTLDLMLYPKSAPWSGKTVTNSRLHFPFLGSLRMRNVTTTVKSLNIFMGRHLRQLAEWQWISVDFTDGNIFDALSPLCEQRDAEGVPWDVNFDLSELDLSE